MYLRPDPDTIRIVPWYHRADGPGDLRLLRPRRQAGRDLRPPCAAPGPGALRRAKGWKPVVAPELEFFLVAGQHRPRSAAAAAGRALGRHGDRPPVLWHRRRQRVRSDLRGRLRLLRGAGDRHRHADPRGRRRRRWRSTSTMATPLELADQAFLFKRTVRQAAMRHNIYATFMAKPMANEPGSSMHIHQSRARQATTGRNLFADSDGRDSRPVPLSCRRAAALPAAGDAAAGAQRELLSPPAALFDAPDQRPMGRRQPHRGLARAGLATRRARRIENRLAGADANPYLAIAASLACGYLGITSEIEPSDPIKGSAYRLAQTLPQQMPDALRKLQQTGPLEGRPGRGLRRGPSGGQVHGARCVSERHQLLEREAAAQRVSAGDAVAGAMSEHLDERLRRKLVNRRGQLHAFTMSCRAR